MDGSLLWRYGLPKKSTEGLARADSNFLTCGVTPEMISMDLIKARRHPEEYKKYFVLGYGQDFFFYSVLTVFSNGHHCINLSSRENYFLVRWGRRDTYLSFAHDLRRCCKTDSCNIFYLNGWKTDCLNFSRKSKLLLFIVRTSVRTRITKWNLINHVKCCLCLENSAWPNIWTSLFRRYDIHLYGQTLVYVNTLLTDRKTVNELKHFRKEYAKDMAEGVV